MLLVSTVIAVPVTSLKRTSEDRAQYMTYVGPSGSCSGGVRSATDHCYSNSCHDYPYASSCYKNRKIIRHSGTCTGVRLGS